MRASLLGLLLLGALAFLGGCGGSSSTTSTSGALTTTAAATAPAPPPVHVVTHVSANVEPGASAKAYARRVDSLLSSSSSNLQDLQMYVSLVATDQLPPDEALDVVRNVLAQGRTALRTAQSLTLPPEFRQSQLLLERSLQLRVDEQQAMLAAGKLRYDNRLAGWQQSFNQAVDVGKEARTSALKFLAVYGAARQKALGTSPSTLPASI